MILRLGIPVDHTTWSTVTALLNVYSGTVLHTVLPKDSAAVGLVALDLTRGTHTRPLGRGRSSLRASLAVGKSVSVTDDWSSLSASTRFVARGLPDRPDYAIAIAVSLCLSRNNKKQSKVVRPHVWPRVLRGLRVRVFQGAWWSKTCLWTCRGFGSAPPVVGCFQKKQCGPSGRYLGVLTQPPCT